MEAVLEEPKTEEMKQENDKIIQACPNSISTPEEFQEGVRWATTARKRIKFLQAHFAASVKSTKAAHEAVKQTRDSFIDPIKAIEKAYIQEVTKYHTAKQAREQAEREKRNRLHQQKINRALAKGQDVSTIAPPATVPQSTKTTKTEDGALTFRKVPKPEIFSPDDVPHQYRDCEPNKKRVEHALKAGVEVPGARLIEVEEPAIRG